MSYIIIGLGNPGEEYENTRHNTGRIILGAVFGEFGEGEWKLDKKSNALVANGKIGKEKVTFVMPETFMNKSGLSAAKFVKSAKAAGKMIVIYDDFNLPLGKLRISYNRSSGGHNGLESIIKAVKTEAFPRIRVGIAPATSKGLAKVPHGEDKIERFILGPYKPDELKLMKKLGKTVAEAIEMLIKDSREKAMSVYNAA